MEQSAGSFDVSNSIVSRHLTSRSRGTGCRRLDELRKPIGI